VMFWRTIKCMKNMDIFFFESDALRDIAVSYKQAYVTAEPFPHVVIDNFLPDVVTEALRLSFPSPEAISWKDKTHEHSKKLASNKEADMPSAIRQFLLQCNSSTFISFLEELSGIASLIPDPHYEGGGMHQIKSGGYLDVHADFNYHHMYHLDRRLNMLLYLNKDWKEEYGGHLELWDRSMKTCVKKVLPIFNRCVIFTTSDFSYHGHPVPLTAPPGETRKSLALYYYTNGRPEGETGGISHKTLYQSPKTHRNVLLRHVKQLLPPIITEIIRRVRKKL